MKAELLTNENSNQVREKNDEFTFIVLKIEGKKDLPLAIENEHFEAVNNVLGFIVKQINN